MCQEISWEANHLAALSFGLRGSFKVALQ